MYTHVRLCTEGCQASCFELGSAVYEPSDQENNFRKCPVIWMYIYITIFGFVARLWSVSSIFLKPYGNTMWKILIMRFVMVLKLQKLTVHVARIEDNSNALGHFMCNSKEQLCTPRWKAKTQKFILRKAHCEHVSWNVVAEKNNP
jgi:hypothetical protein